MESRWTSSINQHLTEILLKGEPVLILHCHSRKGFWERSCYEPQWGKMKISTYLLSVPLLFLPFLLLSGQGKRPNRKCNKSIDSGHGGVLSWTACQSWGKYHVTFLKRRLPWVRPMLSGVSFCWNRMYYIHYDIFWALAKVSAPLGRRGER